MNDISGKNEWVEALRAFLILYIAIHHLTSRYMDFYPEVQFSLVSENGGRVGIFMFMMISGYFLAPTLLKGNGVFDCAKYCANRWWRLFPAVVLCTTITYLVVSIFPLVEERMVTFKEYLCNFLIIHPNIPYVENSHWFVAALLQMQLLLGGLLFIESEKLRVRVIVWLFVFSLVLCLIYDLPKTKIDNILYWITYSAWLPILLSGSILYYIKSTKLPRYMIIAPLIVLCVYVFKYHLFVVIVTFCLFVFAICGKMSVKCPALLTKMGGVSFIWYLLHQNIGFCIINILRNLGIINEVILLSVALIGTLLLAFSVNYFIRLVPRKLFK